MDDEHDDDSSSAFSLTQGPNNVGWCDESLSDFEDQNSGVWADVKDAITVVTFDEATNDAWDAAKSEIGIFRKNIIQNSS